MDIESSVVDTENRAMDIDTLDDTMGTAVNTSASLNSLRIDRKKTCPFMIKMYCRINGHHRLDEFSPPRFPIEDEMIVYTWKDASLKELSLLVREVLGDSELPGGSRGSDANLKFSFNLLYPDTKRTGSHFLSRPLGWAFEGGEPEARAHQLIDSSTRTLDSLRFIPGDFIDVAVYTNPAMIPKNSDAPNERRKIFYSNNRRF